MRLIDSDKLENDIVENITVKAVSRMLAIIQGQPTVKAIPIEWLLSIMRKQIIFAMESEMEGTTTVKDGVIHCVSGALACQVLANVIKLWEKENEENI